MMPGAYKRAKKIKGSRYTAWWIDEHGQRRTRTAFTDLRQSKDLANRLEDEARAIREGLVDASHASARKWASVPLATHIEDYRSHLKAKGDTARHCDHTGQSLAALASAIKAKRLSMIRLDALREALASWRKEGVSARTLNFRLGAFKAFMRWAFESGRLRELPRWIGTLKPSNEETDRRRVRRPLTATELRKLIETTEQGPDFEVKRKPSLRRWHKQVLTVVKAQCLELIQEGVYPSIKVLKTRVEASSDAIRQARARLIRRAEVVIPAEMTEDLNVPVKPQAKPAEKIRCPKERMTGRDRAILYCVAAGTGFRDRELRSLRPEDFDLQALTVTCRAGYTKNRRKATQPISQALGKLLAPWLATRTAGEPVWSMPWASSTMLRPDLARAGIPHETAAGVVDMHSLRHGYISSMIEAGVDPKTVQALARHSTITLTIDRYSHTDDDRKRKAIEKREEA